MKEIVKILTNKNKTIATMESCTGGALANAITNIEGASEVLKFSAITYSNEYKIKMGVDPNVIDKYTVYSIETANEMSKNIAEFAKADYGIGITGQLNRFDPNNLTDEKDIVYVSIYDSNKKYFKNIEITVLKKSREANKQIIINEIIDNFKNMLFEK